MLEWQERFKDLRTKHGTLDFVAQKITDSTGISVSSSLLQKQESDLDENEKTKGKAHTINSDKLIALSKYYGVTTDYLLGLTVDPNKQPCAAEQLGLSQENIEFLAYGKGIYKDGLEEYRLSAIRSFCNSLFDVLKTNHKMHQYIADIEDLHFSEDKYKNINMSSQQAAILELYRKAGEYGLEMLSPLDAAQYYITSVMDSLKESLITSVQEKWGEKNNGKTE